MIVIDKTEKTPLVSFDSSKQIVSLEGICVPENAREFFVKIDTLLNTYKLTCKKITIDLNLEYFNTSSAKRILDLLIELNNPSGHFEEVNIIWRHWDDDLEMIEAGEMFQEIIGKEFQFIVIPKN